MKLLFILSLSFLIVFQASSLQAQSSSSGGNYTVLHGAPGVGSGGHVTNASGTITADIKLGGFFEGTTADSPSASGIELRPDFIGQLADVIGLTVTSENMPIPENSSDQLAASSQLDDGTTLVLDNDLDWELLNGPATITEAGLLAVGSVFEDTFTRVRASYDGFEVETDLAIQNTNDDDYPGYANDGLDDAWQFLHFSELSVDQAAPAADPDGDGQDNAFEFLAVLDPMDPESVFSLVFMDDPAVSGKLDISFWPIAAGRHYQVSVSEDMANFEPLEVPMVEEEGVLTVTDDVEDVGRRLYRVEITKE